MRKIWLLVAIVMLLAGCAYQKWDGACRHEASYSALVAGEWYPVRLAYGKMIPTGTAWNGERQGHIQAQAKIDGEWKWLCVIKGRVWVCSQDQFTVEGYIAGKELVQWFTQRGLMLNK